MPKEPIGSKTHQPPKRQPPSHKLLTHQGPVASAPQTDLVQRAMADPASLTPAELTSLQQMVGNRAVQRLLARPEPPEGSNGGLDLRAEREAGAAIDAYEPQAGQMARQVVQLLGAASTSPVQRAVVNRPGTEDIGYEEDEEELRPEVAPAEKAPAAAAEAPPEGGGSPGTNGGSPGSSGDGNRSTNREGTRKPEDDERKRLRLMREQPGRVGLEGGAVDRGLESEIERARGSGQRLHQRVRGRLEGVFNADFSQVRVHDNRQSDRLNRALSARAFTSGQDLFFKQGEYNPHSTAGQTLLAHELTHVMQQNGAAVQRKPNKDTRRPGAVRQRAGRSRAQRAVWDFSVMSARRDARLAAERERERWKARNTAEKIALVPFGGVMGAATGAARGYRGIYESLLGAQGANASGWRKAGAAIGSGVLGTLALPFTAGLGAVRGLASGLANPAISAAKRAPGAWESFKAFFRQGVGNFRAVPVDQRRGVDQAVPSGSPVRETDDERRSRLTALAGRRGPLPLPGQGGPEGANAREVALNRGENLIASSGVSLGGYAASGLGATAAAGRALTGWSTGTGEAGLLNTVSGATRAVGGLGAISGLAGTGGALLEAGAGLQSATDSTRSGTERGLGGMQAASGVSDAVKQSATASFNIASLTGNAAAAAAATLVAGGAGVVMGVIDMIRGAVQSYNARQREKMLRAVAFAVENDLTGTIPASQKQTLLRTAADVARLQGLQWWGGASTMAKGALTIAGGAVLLAAGLSNPVGWALLGGAAVLGAIYVFYKLREKRKYKRQVAVRELGIKSWRDRWKAEKKKIEAETTWGSPERRGRLRGLGDDPLDITLRSQGYESPGHFYARYITMTAEALHRNVVMQEKPDPQNPQPGDDLRRRSIELLESMGLRIDFTKPAEARTPSARRIAQALDP